MGESWPFLERDHEVNQRFEELTFEIDEDLNQALEMEEDIERELKKELKDYEQLKEATSTALNIIDQMEHLEKEVERHINAAKNGMSKEEAKEVLGNDYDNLLGDLKRLHEQFNSLISGLEQLEEDSQNEAKDINEFSDILNDVKNAESSLDNLIKRLEDSR